MALPAWWFVGATALLVVVVLVSSATVNVGEDERVAYIPMGEYRGLLGPGWHPVLPFVSHFDRYERTPAVTVETTTADGDRLRVCVQMVLDLDAIAQAYRASNERPSSMVELRARARERLSEAIQARGTDEASGAHSDYEAVVEQVVQAHSKYLPVRSVETVRIESVASET